jgi:hypothetical protein
MKWRFKCCSRDSDYLHDRTARRRNDFRDYPDANSQPGCRNCATIEHFSIVRVTSSTHPLRGEIIRAA